ncbi:MAG: bifunctional nuclease family protein [Geobacteraceae bacterium]|nr:bifunctional nuclease family protein [Geobacteraceae bacterium]
MYCEMTVHGFVLDSIAQTPMVILKDADENNALPIWLNSLEAVTIAAELVNRDALSGVGGKDLMTKLFEQLQVKIDRITIDGLEGTTFESYLYFSRDGEDLRVQVRPCEAVVIAMKYSLPIQVAVDVLARASVLDVTGDDGINDDAAARFITFLENLDPKDMGKYPL